MISIVETNWEICNSDNFIWCKICNSFQDHHELFIKDKNIRDGRGQIIDNKVNRLKFNIRLIQISNSSSFGVFNFSIAQSDDLSNG
jgi:hypothetical protein